MTTLRYYQKMITRRAAPSLSEMALSKLWTSHTEQTTSASFTPSAACSIEFADKVILTGGARDLKDEEGNWLASDLVTVYNEQGWLEELPTQHSSLPGSFTPVDISSTLTTRSSSWSLADRGMKSKLVSSHAPPPLRFSSKDRTPGSRLELSPLPHLDYRL